ncbi:hypothetical protein GCM10023169_02250 [Georgenia halophila]|uniref:Pyridoxamine 5'-phosphate oxidase N-terminal domain-containing protein n=1 Tax=Georgenia halophila TaxID=620889 RepID=A0ABP8KU24_9MICO
MPMQFRDDPAGDQFFALTTYRKDGSGVSGPIWLAPDNGHWYGYTPGHSWKVRRLRRDPRVEIAASDFHGEPREPARAGRARILTGRDRRLAMRALTAKYGMQFRIFRLVTLLGRPRRRGGPPVGLEIALDA